MYRKILIPVDLAHVGRLQKALTTAADLGRHYKIPVCYCGVTTQTPSSLAHTPAEFGEKLAAFAEGQAADHGIETTSHPVASHDPTIDLDATLMKVIKETGADLVVMASHVPNITDYIWPSNGGTIATHSSASVFVVRET